MKSISEFDMYLEVIGSAVLMVGTALTTIRAPKRPGMRVIFVAAEAACPIILIILSLLSASRRAAAASIFHSAFLAFVLIAAGSMLFYVKRRSLLVYGSIELLAAFAAAICVSIVDQSSDFARIASALTSVYFVVRGLGNVQEGWAQFGASKRLFAEHKPIP